MQKVNVHKVALKFFDFDYLPAKLTDDLGLEPTKTALQGQLYHVGPKLSKIERKWSWNFWMYQVIVEKSRFQIGDQIDDFIEHIIKPRQEKIKNIASTCSAEFSIVQYIYDSCNPGLFFNKSQLKVISNIGVEIDIDIYVLGNGDGPDEDDDAPT